MVIGLSFRRRVVSQAAFLLLAFVFLVLRVAAQDQITLKGGSVVSGQIVGMSGGQVTINAHASNGGVAKLNFPLSNIQAVTMTPPAAVAQAGGASPEKVIAALEPVVKEYAGLPALWVIDAMGQLADAYDSGGHAGQAAAIYAQINQLYPNSPYQNEAVAGQAKLDLQAGKIDEALAALKPLIDKANTNIAPSPAEGRLDANVFLVYGQALQAQKQYPQALEAYLTVTTMFYQNPALVAQAEQLAKTLRDQNPGVGVD